MNTQAIDIARAVQARRAPGQRQVIPVARMFPGEGVRQGCANNPALRRAASNAASSDDEEIEDDDEFEKLPVTVVISETPISITESPAMQAEPVVIEIPDSPPAAPKPAPKPASNPAPKPASNPAMQADEPEHVNVYPQCPDGVRCVCGKEDCAERTGGCFVRHVELEAKLGSKQWSNMDQPERLRAIELLKASTGREASAIKWLRVCKERDAIAADSTDMDLLLSYRDNLYMIMLRSAGPYPEYIEVNPLARNVLARISARIEKLKAEIKTKGQKMLLNVAAVQAQRDAECRAAVEMIQKGIEQREQQREQKQARKLKQARISPAMQAEQAEPVGSIEQFAPISPAMQAEAAPAAPVAAPEPKPVLQAPSRMSPLQLPIAAMDAFADAVKGAVVVAEADAAAAALDAEEIPSAFSIPVSFNVSMEPLEEPMEILAAAREAEAELEAAEAAEAEAEIAKAATAMQALVAQGVAEGLAVADAQSSAEAQAWFAAQQLARTATPILKSVPFDFIPAADRKRKRNAQERVVEPIMTDDEDTGLVHPPAPKPPTSPLRRVYGLRQRPARDTLRPLFVF